MTSRLLLVALVIANLLVAVWWSQRPVRGLAPIPPIDPGVPSLQLLTEQDADAADAEEWVGPPEALANPNGERCYRLGPFVTSAEMRRAWQVLNARSSRSQMREEQRVIDRGFWVYITAPDGNEARAQARRLAAAGFEDYYVVGSGANRNRLSLGLYRDLANAQSRQADLAAAGFTSLVEPRRELEPHYFVEFSTDSPAPAADVVGSQPLELEEIDC